MTLGKQARTLSKKRKPRISAITVLTAIAAADGKLPGHDDYLTKLQMIALARAFLIHRKGRI